MIAGRPTCSSASMARATPAVEVQAAVGAPGRGDDGGARVLEADPLHRLAEQLAVLGHLDRLAAGADHLDAVPGEDAHLLEAQRGVEAGLAAHRRQERVGLLALDDLGDDLGRDRLDVGGVGELRVGHDRRRVRVDEDHPVALLAQRLAGLGARIVELAALADDDGPRADDQDRADVGALRHQGPRDKCRRVRQIARVIDEGLRGTRPPRPFAGERGRSVRRQAAHPIRTMSLRGRRHPRG